MYLFFYGSVTSACKWLGELCLSCSHCICLSVYASKYRNMNHNGVWYTMVIISYLQNQSSLCCGH